MDRRLTALAITGVLVLGLAGCSDGGTASGPSSSTAGTAGTSSTSAGPAPSATPSAALPTVTESAPADGTPAAVAWEALTGVEGEYRAQARYAAVIDAFGQVEPYVTVREAEGRHVNALVRQLERLGVDVPGNPYLGRTQAPADLVAAAKEGVAGEVANVAMYDTLLTRATDPVLTRVLQNLRSASEDVHLPLFTAAAAAGGVLTTQQMTDLGLAGR